MKSYPLPLVYWVIALVSVFFYAPVNAEELEAIAVGTPEPFQSEADGQTLHSDHASLSLETGYPYTSAQFLAAPTTYFNVGIRLDVDYRPAFDFRAPLIVQMLETSDERFNLALEFRPGMFFNFGSTTSMEVPLSAGTRFGYRFVETATYFTQLLYTTDFGISDGYFDHYPQIKTGFEIRLSEEFNLLVSGLAEFKRYEPEKFIYGGQIGFVYLMIP